jgi:hypothetical protein
VPSAPRPCVLELPSTIVADEIVTGADVVDAKAVGARVALADVALQKSVVVNDALSPSVLQTALGDRLPAGLASTGRFHGFLPRLGAQAGVLEVP